jgi:Low affinity iron permease
MSGSSAGPTLSSMSKRATAPRRRMIPFDRVAQAAADFTSRGTFFGGCVLLIALWAPSYLVFRNVDTWQLIINTATTIVTFLLVALLQNSARRSERATHQKLDALAEGLADLMEHQLSGDTADLKRDINDLKHAVGLEKSLPELRRSGSARARRAPRRAAGRGSTEPS